MRHDNGYSGSNTKNMKAVEFEGVNIVLGKDQPQYQPLPAMIDTEAEGVPITCCFELSDEELDEIKSTGKIWYTVLSFGQNFYPINMSTKKPF